MYFAAGFFFALFSTSSSNEPTSNNSDGGFCDPFFFSSSFSFAVSVKCRKGNHLNISFYSGDVSVSALVSGAKFCRRCGEQSEFDQKKEGRGVKGVILIAPLVVLVGKCVVGSGLSLTSCLSSMRHAPSGGVFPFFFFNFENILFFLLLLSRKRGTPAG